MFAEAKSIYERKSIEVKYIIINVVFYLAIRLASFIALPFNEGFNLGAEWLSLPSNLIQLIYQPWTIFTYMFTHLGFFHLLWNMVGLYYGGMIFSDLLGKDRFIKTYWLGGILGGLLYLVAYNIFPQLDASHSILLGASASVLAIMIGIAVYVPNYTVYLPLIGPAKLKFIAVVFVILLLPVTIENEGGHIAHLGGMSWGILWAYYLKSGKELGTWFDGIRSYFSRVFSRTPGLKSNNNTKPKPRPTKRINDLPNQEEVDRILDKVGKSGYESLTEEEKNILFNASK